MRHDGKKKGRTEQNQRLSEIVSTELSLRHTGQTSEEKHQKRNYISRIKMRGEHERKMREKLCKVALIQAKKKKSTSILSLLKGHKE